MNQRLVLLVDALCKQALEKDGEGWVVTPEFVLALSGTVGKLCTDLFAEDLIAFSQHAKRKTVAIEDVLLLVRRSPDLVRRVEAVMNEEKPVTTTTTTGKNSKARTAATAPPPPKRQSRVLHSESDSDEEEEGEDVDAAAHQHEEEQELFND